MPEDFNDLIASPARLRVCAALGTRGEASFTELKEATGLTDGNLVTHMLRLENGGLVRSQKALLGGRKNTLYRLTTEGSDELLAFLSWAERSAKAVKGKPKRQKDVLG
jgi:DNA-binding MarR family transcriptional regulator